jgi:hypothetical protein
MQRKAKRNVGQAVRTFLDEAENAVNKTVIAIGYDDNDIVRGRAPEMLTPSETTLPWFTVSGTTLTAATTLPALADNAEIWVLQGDIPMRASVPAGTWVARNFRELRRFGLAFGDSTLYFMQNPVINVQFGPEHEYHVTRVELRVTAGSITGAGSIVLETIDTIVAVVNKINSTTFATHYNDAVERHYTTTGVPDSTTDDFITHSRVQPSMVFGATRFLPPKSELVERVDGKSTFEWYWDVPDGTRIYSVDQEAPYEPHVTNTYNNVDYVIPPRVRTTIPDMPNLEVKLADDGTSWELIRLVSTERAIPIEDWEFWLEPGYLQSLKVQVPTVPALTTCVIIDGSIRHRVYVAPGLNYIPVATLNDKLYVFSNTGVSAVPNSSQPVYVNAPTELPIIHPTEYLSGEAPINANGSLYLRGAKITVPTSAAYIAIVQLPVDTDAAYTRSVYPLRFAAPVGTTVRSPGFMKAARPMSTYAIETYELPERFRVLVTPTDAFFLADDGVIYKTTEESPFSLGRNPYHVWSTRLYGEEESFGAVCDYSPIRLPQRIFGTSDGLAIRIQINAKDWSTIPTTPTTATIKVRIVNDANTVVASGSVNFLEHMLSVDMPSIYVLIHPEYGTRSIEALVAAEGSAFEYQSAEEVRGYVACFAKPSAQTSPHYFIARQYLGLGWRFESETYPGRYLLHLSDTQKIRVSADPNCGLLATYDVDAWKFEVTYGNSMTFGALTTQLNSTFGTDFANAELKNVGSRYKLVDKNGNAAAMIIPGTAYTIVHESDSYTNNITSTPEVDTGLRGWFLTTDSSFITATRQIIAESVEKPSTSSRTTRDADPEPEIPASLDKFTIDYGLLNGRVTWLVRSIADDATVFKTQKELLKIQFKAAGYTRAERSKIYAKLALKYGPINGTYFTKLNIYGRGIGRTMELRDANDDAWVPVATYIA